MSWAAIKWVGELPISAPAKPVLTALAIMADEGDNSCFPGHKRLATLTGYSEITVRRSVAELEDRGLILRERRTNAKGYRTSDRYWLQVKDTPNELTDHKDEEPTGLTDHKEGKSYRSVGAGLAISQIIPTDLRDRAIEELVEEPVEEPDIPTRPVLTAVENINSDGMDIKAAFTGFYEAYPKQVAMAKALKAFERALRKTDAKTLTAAARAYAAVCGPVDNFTPHPHTWLDDERWTDDMAALSRAGVPKQTVFQQNVEAARARRAAGGALAIEPFGWTEGE